MLDIHRGVDFYTSVEQLCDILPAFRMPRARGIGVGQFVHQEQGWATCQGGIEVKFVEGGAMVYDWAPGQCFEPCEQRGGLRPAVRIHPAYYDVDTLSAAFVRRFEHGIRFPY